MASPGSLRTLVKPCTVSLAKQLFGASQGTPAHYCKKTHVLNQPEKPFFWKPQIYNCSLHRVKTRVTPAKNIIENSICGGRSLLGTRVPNPKLVSALQIRTKIALNTKHEIEAEPLHLSRFPFPEHGQKTSHTHSACTSFFPLGNPSLRPKRSKMEPPCQVIAKSEYTSALEGPVGTASPRFEPITTQPHGSALVAQFGHKASLVKWLTNLTTRPRPHLTQSKYGMLCTTWWACA